MSLWEENKTGAELIFAPIQHWVRVALVLMALAMGTWTARAAAPVLTLPSSITIGEDDYTNLPVGVSDGAVAIFTVTTSAKSSNTNLFSNSHLTFNGAGTSRLLSIIPGLHKSGTATITVIASDSQPSSTTNTFTVNVTATNYPPFFTSTIPNETRNENASATNWSFSISDIETAAASLTVTATSTNTTLVPNSNLVLSGTGTNRTLTVTPATNQNGTTLISLVIADGGGATATNTFLLNVLSVNQPPTVTFSTNRLVFNQNFGAVTNTTLISNISSGPANQSSESNYFVLSYTTNFYAQTPAVDTNGVLTFQVGTNISGTSLIKFVLVNSGSITNGGQNSLTNTLTLDVLYVNQAPTFNLSTNLLVLSEEAKLTTNAAFLTGIYVGATNQSGQTWTFTTLTPTNNATNVEFTLLPTVATNGALTLQPLAHTYGTNTVTVIMTTTGSTTNGGINSYTNNFLVSVAPISHAPTINQLTNVVALENATNVTATVNVWDYDLAVSNFVFTATSLSNNLATVSVTGTNIIDASNAVYTLTINLGTNQNGSNSIQLIATEASLSSTNNLGLTVKSVNQPPTFGFSTNLLLLAEEAKLTTNTAFLTGIYVGATNQIGQTWTFTTQTPTNNATNAEFTVLPTVATNGALTLQPLAHTYGTNTVTVIMTTTGSTTNGGINSYTNSFLVGITTAAHAPTINQLTNVVALENATNVTATVNVWDYDLAVSNFVFTATSLSNNLATVSVTATNIINASNAVYTLTINLGTNQNGSNAIQLIATEASLSSTNTLGLTVKSVNQPPTFGLSTNFLLLAEESTLTTNAAFLTGIYVGATNQSGQTWTFTTQTPTNNATNAEFTVLPTVATNGTLTLQPLAHTYGTNTVTVVMTTTGSTTNGGINSYTNSFLVGITTVSHAPTINQLTNVVALENATNVTATVNVWDYDLAVSNFVFTATSLSNNLATVSVTGTNIINASNAVYTLTINLGTNQNGSNAIQLIATEASLSATNNLGLTVKSVNQPPTFGLSTNFLLLAEESTLTTNAAFLTGIYVGATNQSGQTWTFTTQTPTNNATNAEFTVLPTVATNGTLTLQPLAHTYGTNTVTVIMTTTGSTTNGGINSYTNSFLVGIMTVSHAPTINQLTNVVALENATNVTATVNVWDYDLAVSNFVFTATSLSNNLATVSVTGTNIINASNAVYTLTINLGTNQNGSNAIQLIATEASLSSTNNLGLTVKAVNQPPSFGFATNVLVIAENAGLLTNNNFMTNIYVGATNQSGQTWTFAVFCGTNNATNVTFAQFPTAATNGTLTFKTANYSFGTNTVFVAMTTTGSTNNGGIISVTNSFVLSVTQVAYPPAIMGLTNKTILENATTNLSMPFTLFDPLTNVFTVTCTSGDTNLVALSLTGTGTNRTLVFAPGTNTFGTNTFIVTADDGALTNSVTNTVAIVWVNQAPSFTLASTAITVDKYDTAISIANFATNILAGPTNESSQIVNFVVTNSNPALFLSPPAVNASGTLSFTPAKTGGTITVGIKAVDNGGTLNGGVNASTNRILTITIPANPYPYLTGPFTGLFYDTNSAANESAGYFNLALNNDGGFSGYVLCAGNSNGFTGQFTISNATATVTAGNYALNLTVDTTANWTESVSGSVSNTAANWNVPLTAYLAGYSTSFQTALAGTYLMAMPGFPDASAGPAGDSVFNVVISPSGSVALTGYTADNTFASEVSQLSVAGYYPVYVPLYDSGTKGVLIGWLSFTQDPADSLTGDSILTWINESGATTLYPNGFTNQAVPVASSYDTTMGDILPFSSGTVILSGGNLTTPITNSVAISSDVITADPSATNHLSLHINTTTGEILGSFVTGSHQTNYIDSAILQNANSARGYFLGNTEGGSFLLQSN